MSAFQIKYWLALKSISGIGNTVFSLLLQKFSSLEAVFSAPMSDLLAIKGINKEIALSIIHFRQWDEIRRQMDYAHDNRIKIVTCLDAYFPKKLKEIYDCPVLLYVQGDLSPNDVNIAIVGSRAASTYGKYTTERLSRELSLRGITIVSGLARGIDSAAHRGALSVKGRTIAVLGSGLDIIYPPENKKLFSAISESGAVVSEFPPGTKPVAFNFPARNRIISGMSFGVVIVEAGEKSGSLITARLAAEQGREVFAVPGSIDSINSRGTNSLIKQGAKLIDNIDDILDDVLPQLETKKYQPSFCNKENISPDPKMANCEIIKTPTNDNEKKIIEVISQKTMHTDEIIDGTGLTSAEVLSALVTLELKGLICQHPGKYYSLKTPNA